jgi:hypothetical protein
MGAYNQESITVSDTAKSFTAATIDPSDPDSAFKAVFVVEDANIRFRVDGGDPTASVGLLAKVGAVVTITGNHDVRNFKAIRVTTDATIQPSYFNGKDLW